VLAVDLRARVGAMTLELALSTAQAPLALAGPNGAGKTSLLLLILGVLRPDAGRVGLGDRVLFDAARGIDVPTEERRIGYVPQDYALFPHMTVVENLEFALACHDRDGAHNRGSGPRRRARRDEAMALLADLEVSALAPRRPRTLSGGERQRVALARALAVAPEALLLDEPLAALDVGARRQVRAFLASYLTRLGLPAIVVTHDPTDAVALGERIAVVEAGRLVQVGTAAELRAAPASPFVAEFLASAP
jgi:molybdate transport system ATP-binding protein